MGSRRMPLSPPDKANRRNIEARRDGGKVYLSVDSKALGCFSLPGHTFGLALLGCTLRYRDVRWEFMPPRGPGRDGGKGK